MWRNLPDAKRLNIMDEYFAFYKLDRSKYSVEKGVKFLDAYYSFAFEKIKSDDSARVKADTYFNNPTLLVFGSIVNDRKNDWRIRQLEI